MVIEATVAMPVWDSRRIAWLPVEGLCRQEKPEFEWELIICEERHKGQCGKDFFEGYQERLEKSGCADIKHIEPEEWIPPGLKWHIMGKNISDESRVFIIHGADDYSFPERLKYSHRRISEGNAWYDVQRCYFYHVLKGHMMEYDKPVEDSTHINIAFSSEAARIIPENDRGKCIDSYLHCFCKDYFGESFRKHIDPGFYRGVATDGFNHITKMRDKRYKKPKHPFYKTKKTIRDIGLPEDVVGRLEKMK